MTPALDARAHENPWAKLCRAQEGLDAVLIDVRWLAEDHAYSTAAKRFGEFRIREERQIRAEEQLLHLLEHLPEPPPVLEELRAEQRRITALLEAAAYALARRDSVAFASELTALRATLAVHQDAQRAALVPEPESLE